ncbi:MAG: hypothetical protein CTY28_10310 [Hyphomicrobium sp.]|nr:MAG: hypothetical protein CTY28_10310 [Hyphomicrobium sp.]
MIDGQKPRRAKDVLFMAGYQNTVILVTAARWVVAYRHGYERTNNEISPSNLEIELLIGRHKQLPACVNQIRGAIGPYPGLIAFLHYVNSFVAKYPDTSLEFVEVFKTGVPSRPGCPAHRLREYFIKERSSGVTLKREDHFRLLVGTWNAFIGQGEVTRLSKPKSVWLYGVDKDRLWVPDSLKPEQAAP